MYARDEDYIFASEKLSGTQPRSGSQLVVDYTVLLESEQAFSGLRMASPTTVMAKS